jgi:acyl-CoA ligase (AMP-forming) (exosortase A-associated)
MKCELHHLVTHSAANHPDAPALTDKSATLTYADLESATRSFAGGLVRWGLNRQDRVAVYLDKRTETVISMFGASSARGVFVPVNPLFRAKQVVYILADCDVRLLVTSPERLALLVPELGASPDLEAVVLVGGNDEAVTAAVTALGVEVISWDEFGAAGVAPPAETGVIDTDIAAIFYTSGSTGKPKGVVLSHRNLLVGASSVSHYLGNVADDVILAALPLSFDAGFSQLTTAFEVGAHVVLHNYVLAGDLVRACSRYGVTGLTCVPPLWIQIAGQEWPAEATATMRYFANTGGRMPKSTLDRLRELFPVASPYLMYGLTEAFRSTYLDPAEVDRRPDSIGKAIPNAEILVVRPDGSQCDPGEEGELVHRGALVALGYWNDADRTAERFRPVPGREDSGWRTIEMSVWSGDVVVRDEAGFLYFIGRRDEMIKTSGYRVSPTEIEEVAYDTGLVRDAVAIGVEDDRLGQHIVLAVAPVDPSFSDEELLARMRQQLPLYMVPAAVHVRDELPRSPNGKFDRTLLRDELTS